MGTCSNEEQFCLRWNDFQDSITSSLYELRRDREFLDVTLWCAESDEQIMAHKVVLSACSSFFKSVLRRNTGPNPVIVLWDVSASDLETILSFMYNGEVKVRQEQLNSFLSVAERLRVRGLCQGNSSPSSNHGSANNNNNANAAGNAANNNATTSSSSSSSSHKMTSMTSSNRRSRRRSSSGESPSTNKRTRTSDEDEEKTNEAASNDDTTTNPSSPMTTVVHPSVSIKEEESNDDDEQQRPSHLSATSSQIRPNNNEERDELSRSEGQSDVDYSEYGYGPDGGDGYNDKPIPPPVVGMLLGDRMDAMMDPNVNKGPWNSPGAMNRSGHRLGSNDSFGGRRPRSVYTTQQLTQLEAYFRFNEYIDGDRKKQLSIITQIPEQQIKVWFQNRRQKKKRELEEQTASSMFSDQTPSHLLHHHQQQSSQP